MGYKVKPQSPTPEFKSTSQSTFTQPKSPVNFGQYNQQNREEYPPMDHYRFPRSRTRRDRNVRSLDFEAGLREENGSTSSEAPSYRQYPEDECWEDRSRGRQIEREYPKPDVEVTGTIVGDMSQPPSSTLETGQRAETAHLPASNLHPYVCTPLSTH